MRHLIVAFALAMVPAVSAVGQTTDTNKLKDHVTGDAKVQAPANPQCKLFTQTEIASYAGAPLGAGENAAGGAGCNWHDNA